MIDLVHTFTLHIIYIPCRLRLATGDQLCDCIDGWGGEAIVSIVRVLLQNTIGGAPRYFGDQMQNKSFLSSIISTVSVDCSMVFDFELPRRSVLLYTTGNNNYIILWR